MGQIAKNISKIMAVAFGAGILIFVVVLIFSELSEKYTPTIDSVTVGMSYDRVQSLLGSPVAIERGVRTLRVADNESIFTESVQFKSLDSQSFIKYITFVYDNAYNRNVWIDKPLLVMDGEDDYSVWYYDTTTVGIRSSFSMDTIKVVEPTIEMDVNGVTHLTDVQISLHFVFYIKAVIFDVASGRVMSIRKIPAAIE